MEKIETRVLKSSAKNFSAIFKLAVLQLARLAQNFFAPNQKSNEFHMQTKLQLLFSLLLLRNDNAKQCYISLTNDKAILMLCNTNAKQIFC